MQHKAPNSSKLYPLIDRLQKCKEYSTGSKWSNDTYYSVAFAWMGKEKELEKRVLELESKLPKTTKK